MSVSLKIKIFDKSGTRILQVAKSNLTIGSAPHCDVVIDEPTVNPEHTRAWVESGRIWIQDLGGAGGTALNDIRLPALKPMLVRDLDVLRLGESTSTIGLEAIAVRAPVVKPQSSTVPAVDPKIAEAEQKAAAAELQKRKTEAEALAREVADLRLQLQMANLDKTAGEEMTHQLSTLRSEVERVQEHKKKWDDNFRKLESEKADLRKEIDKELAQFKADSLAQLTADVAKLREQSEKLKASLQQAESDKTALREEVKRAQAAAKTHAAEALRAEAAGGEAASAEIKKNAEKTAKLIEALKQAETEREVLRKSVERERAEAKSAAFKEANAVLANEQQKFDAWKRDALAEMGRHLTKLSTQKIRVWGNRPLTVDMVAEWEADVVQSLQRVLVNENLPEAPPVHTGRQTAKMLGAADKSPEAEAREARRAKRRRDARRSAKIWRQVGVASLVVAFVLAGVWFTSMYLRNHGARSLSSMVSTPVADVDPAKTAPSKGHLDIKPGKKYRGSYTENVLYLENYVAAEENAEFHKRWIAELTKVATAEWKVDSWSLSPVSVEEQNLIQELVRLRAAITPDREAEGIQAMHDREEKFMKDLESAFGNRAGIERFLRFKRAFYQRNQAYLSRVN